MSASLVCTLLGVVVPAFAEPSPEPEARVDSGAMLDDGVPPAHVVLPGPPEPEPAPLYAADPLPAPRILLAPAAPASLAAPKRAPTGYFQIGAGYRTDDGFVASTSVGQTNLFGTGNKLALSGAISKRQQQFGAQFVDPMLFGSDLSLTVDGYYDRRLLPGFWRDAIGGSVTLSKQYGKHWRAFVGYRFESVAIEPEAIEVARGAERTSDRLSIGAVRAGYVFDNRDDPLAPRRGGRLGATLELADRSLGSDVGLLRYNGFGDYHKPIGSLTLHVGGTVEVVNAGGVLGSIPRSERLYLDGSSELRGYLPGHLAPLGANAKGTWRTELEVPLISKWGLSAVGFFDAAAFIGAGQLHSGASVGAGLLWRSPIGPIRVDYAIPLDGSKPGFVISMGGAF
ncbi:MAG: BamA/TamA family outer membrane protein [Kofleriaceae bacterium]|nr:BamA/TamA family outer membrane protein [Kofleriaceae bacterium]